jgi:hypothetical protein
VAIESVQNSIANDTKKVVSNRKMVLVAILFVINLFWSQYKWQLKIGFGHHPKKLDHYMVTKIFQSLAIEFGKWACNIFLESSH